MSHAPPSSLVVNSSIALCCLIWGSTWQVIEQGLRDLPPFTAAAARFLLAGLLMSAAAPWLHRHEGGAPPPRFLWITLGSCTFFGSYGIVYQAETRLAPGVTAVLFAVFSLLMAIAGYLFLGERVSMRQAIGFVLGFLGVAWLFVSDLALLGSDVLGAALLMLGSPLLSAVGTTVTKRCGRNVSSVLLNRNALLLGAVLLTALAFAREQPLAVTWTLRALLSIAWLAAVGTCLSFGIYHWCLRWAPANRLSLVAVVTPCISVALDGTLGGRPVSSALLAGTTLVVLGVVLVVLRAPARRQ